NCNEVCAITQVVRLAHFKSCDLGNGIRLVGVLQRRGEQVLLLHRLGTVARVNAAAAKEHKLLHAIQISRMYYVGLYHQVLVDELCPEGIVGHDPANLRGTEYDCRWFLGRKKRLCIILAAKIELCK